MYENGGENCEDAVIPIITQIQVKLVFFILGHTTLSH